MPVGLLPAPPRRQPTRHLPGAFAWGRWALMRGEAWGGGDGAVGRADGPQHESSVGVARVASQREDGERRESAAQADCTS
eukprot:9503844-Pyramimonas_sp.AAC.3